MLRLQSAEGMADTAQTVTFQLSKEDESLQIASKSFQRIIDAASKRGYREGSVTASEHILQRGFDVGYVDAFDVAFALGKYKSMMRIVPRTVKHPLEMRIILEETRRGACYICKLEEEVNVNYPMEKSFSYITNAQKKESSEVLRRFNKYFNP